ncbi:hypothetical protein [Jannaschia sp. LMIT008]|uniref:hypothetical protein n=1 Tax=Jannaschia maritima TaxID=3032585 RepID=UPI0028116904|nr:hypothetical protein [Jannaschia sp. LMIT008]
MGRTTGLVIDLQKEAPNVVTEPKFRELLAQGYQAEVLCRSDAYYKSAVWYGAWVLRVVDREGTFERLLVNIPRRVTGEPEVAIKVFKTINGLTTFMARMGFTHIHVPLLEGGRSSLALPTEVMERIRKEITQAGAASDNDG